MTRLVATGFAALAMLCLNVQAGEPRASADAEERVATDEQAAKAVEQARNELAQRFAATAAEFELVSVERARWNDSSLGCGRPGSVYLQVISDGYAVILERAGKQHEVHVSGRTVVVCEPSKRAGGLKMPTRAQGLQEASTRARNDLAQRLHLKPNEVRVVRMEPQRWPDRSLGCSRAGPSDGSVSGYKLHLKAAGRIYTYHTDLENVFPCPPIEEE